MDKYLILQIEGGIGKNVVATAVVRALQKKYSERKIIIVTAHPDIWECNPRVHRVLQFGAFSYFYSDYIENRDTIVCCQEPYRSEDYIYNRKHLSQIWCELCGVEWDGEKPELYFTHLEYEFLSELIKKDRPIFLIQAFGGAPNQGHKYSWARDIPPPIAQQIVDEMIKEYRVIQVRREDQIPLNGCESLSLNPRQLALSLMYSDKRLLIDSYMQHAASALGLKSTVLWVVNSPKVLGYGMHQNISSKFRPGSLKNSMYEPYDIIGNPIQLSDVPNDIFDVNEIIKNLKK